MIKLVAFDWNGTLLSDFKSTLDATNHTLVFLKSKPITSLEYKTYFRIPLADFYHDLGINKEDFLRNTKAIAAIWHKYYEKRASKSRTRSSTRKLLAWLGENQIASVIFSNHTHLGIEKQLRRLNITNLFQTVLANSEQDSAYKAKGKKEKLKDYIKSNKLKFSEVLVVGDSAEEVEIGQEFGSKTIAITNGYYITRRLKSAKPDYLIHNLKEVINIIKKLNGQ